MSKTADEIADEIISKMSQQELLAAAKVGVMMTMRTTIRILEIIQKEVKKEKQKHGS